MHYKNSIDQCLNRKIITIIFKKTYLMNGNTFNDK